MLFSRLAARFTHVVFVCVVALGLGAHYAFADANVPIASALRRVPQVAINGSALQAHFASVGESIDALHDQIDVGLLTARASSSSTFSMQIEQVADAGAAVSGFYNGHAASPALMPVFPAGSGAGWFAVINFRSFPERAVVSCFDANASLVSTNTYLDVDRFGIGWYVQGPGGTIYSQDARNSGGAPQLLFYHGTGLNRGAAWVAAEMQPVAGDRDYDDQIWFLQGDGAVCIMCDASSNLTSVRRARWGELKAHFR